jgi:hypothetical protein
MTTTPMSVPATPDPAEGSRVPATSEPRTRATRRPGSGARLRRRSRPAESRESKRDARCLARYRDPRGLLRELIVRRGAAGSVLVLDRDATTRRDRRLVAHLGADEPRENAKLVCDRYVQDAHRGRCRHVTPSDLAVDPYACETRAAVVTAVCGRIYELADTRGPALYRLEFGAAGSIRELRWRAYPSGAAAPSIVSLRHVVGAVESYEPACGLTLEGIALYREDARVSVATVRGEHARLRASPIVLNRGLREAVLSAVEPPGVSMSEIALRCGRIKRDGKGNASGETSWLARRIGLVAESGATRPTPWIHTDVLALIARAGLGVSPREVELE